MKRYAIRLASILMLACATPSVWAADTVQPVAVFLETGGNSIQLDGFAFGVNIELISQSGGGGGSHATAPGNFEWVPLTFTRTIETGDTFFLQWEEDMLENGGSAILRDLTIQILASTGQVAFEWDLTDVWLSEVETFFSDDEQSLGKQRYTLIVSSATWTAHAL